MKSNRLIFLISLPRSGSTLLQAILGSHPGIHTSSEPWIALMTFLARNRLHWESSFNSNWARLGINAFLEENEVPEQVIRDGIRDYLINIYQFCLEQSGKEFFLDKTPRYYEIIPELVETFPESRFIVLRRNPAHVMSSILKTWVKQDYEKLLYYRRDLIDAIEKINDFNTHGKSNFLDVYYEDVLDNPEKSIKGICDFIEIEFNASMMQYKKNEQWLFGDKKYQQWDSVKTTQSSANRFDNLNEKQLGLILNYVEGLGAELCSGFGYDLTEMVRQLEDASANRRHLKTWQTIIGYPLFKNTDDQAELLKAKLNKSSFSGLFRH